MKNKPLRFVVLIGCALIALAGTLGWLQFSKPWVFWPKQDFSSSAWMMDSARRYRLAKDLVTRGYLDGMTSAQVEGLLGPADSKAPDGSYVTYILREASTGDVSFNSLYLLQVNFASGRVNGVLIRAD